MSSDRPQTVELNPSSARIIVPFIAWLAIAAFSRDFISANCDSFLNS
jgi:hypothetical protein